MYGYFISPAGKGTTMNKFETQAQDAGFKMIQGRDLKVGQTIACRHELFGFEFGPLMTAEVLELEKHDYEEQTAYICLEDGQTGAVYVEPEEEVWVR